VIHRKGKMEGSASRKNLKPYYETLILAEKRNWGEEELG